MADDTRDLEKKVRDAESKLKVTEAALKDVKSRRIGLAFWSAAGGIVLFGVVGHWFPGYQLDSTARATSKSDVAEALSDVVAELCVERFMKGPGLATRLEGLKDANGDWSKASYIRQGTWAETSDGQKSDQTTAGKCVTLITEREDAADAATAAAAQKS